MYSEYAVRVCHQQLFLERVATRVAERDTDEVGALLRAICDYCQQHDCNYEEVMNKAQHIVESSSIFLMRSGGLLLCDE